MPILTSFYPIFYYLKLTAKIPNFVQNKNYPNSNFFRQNNPLADLFIKSSKLPFFKNYIDYPMVYSRGSHWKASPNPVPICNMPFYVQSFLITFDYFKHFSASKSDITRASLCPFQIRFQTNSFSFSIKIFFRLNVTAYDFILFLIKF